MKHHIIFFSGGLGSFSTAHLIKQKHPSDNIILLFTDTLWEDYDLYRFIHECSDKLKLPLLKLEKGMNPIDLMKKDKFLYNSRIARCSIELKVKPARDFIFKNKYTEHYEWYNKHFLISEDIENPTLYFGIGYQEIHRTHAIIKNWSPYQCEFPLVEEIVDNKELLKLYDIEIPKLYKLGFAHNNCGGRCIKGGQGHWVNLLKEDYQSFQEMRDFEIAMNNIINAKNGKNEKYSFIKRSVDGISKAYQLVELENDYNNRPKQIDMFDIGACGCFIDEE